MVIIGFDGVTDVKRLDLLVNMSVRKAKKFDSFYSEYIVGTQNLTLWKSYGLSNLCVLSLSLLIVRTKKAVKKILQAPTAEISALCNTSMHKVCRVSESNIIQHVLDLVDLSFF